MYTSTIFILSRELYLHEEFIYDQLFTTGFFMTVYIKLKTDMLSGKMYKGCDENQNYTDYLKQK